MVKKKLFLRPSLPKIFSSPYFLLIRSKVTKYMPMARKNMTIATFIALLCGHNALNLTVTTVYLLAAVTFMFLEVLIANQFAIQFLSTLRFQLRTLTFSVLAFVVL